MTTNLEEQASISFDHSEWRQAAADGLDLYFQSWSPAGPAQAVICLVHGLGEHSGRYSYMARKLNQAGYAVISFDHRGHGKSEGQRGHTPSYETYLADIDLLLAQGHTRFPSLPFFLYGHSLGANLVLFYTIRRQPQLAGVIAASNGLRNVLEKQTLKVWIAKLIGKILPALPMSSGLDAQLISRDSAVVSAYLQDPYIHDRVTAGWARHSLISNPWIRDHAAEFSLPLLLMHGTGDQLTLCSGCQEFGAQVQGDVTVKLWEGLAHELHNEPEKEQVLAYLLDWIQARIPD